MAGEIRIEPASPVSGGTMKLPAILLLACASMVGVAVAQDTTTTSSSTSHTTAKQDMKDAGHSTTNAAKDVGHATKKTSKKVVHKSASKTEEGSRKVKDKTAPQQ
jgi:hypothetical protein